MSYNKGTGMERKEELLRKLQKAEYKILEDIDKLCRENEIQYFIADGTLLGAVRHGGFIPWDDDIDIGMLRKDYNKFIKIAPGLLDEKYTLECWETNQYYGYGFAKVMNNRTKFIDAVSENVKCCKGIYIDVFPYDAMPEKNIKAYSFLLWNLGKLIQMKNGYENWKSYMANHSVALYRPYILLSKLFSRKFLIRNYQKIVNRLNKLYPNSKICFENFDGGMLKLNVEREWIKKVKPIQFEQGTFWAPDFAHEYLQSFYGDYMKLPSKEKQKSYHDREKIEFEDCQ